MKKIFLLLLVAALTHTVTAQKNFTTYHTDYKDLTCDIKISEDKDGNGWSLWIDMEGNEGGIKVTSKTYPEFIQSLKEAETKYSLWDSTAKVNNVEDATKDMDIKCNVEGYFMYGSKWCFDNTVTLSYSFWVRNLAGETRNLLLIRTGSMVSFTNEYMKDKGKKIIFYSPNEVNAFLDAISPEKINAFLKSPKAEDLFK